MFPGFLSRATLMFDVVSLAMVVVLPVLTWSIYLVKYKRNYVLHKRLQVGLGIALLAAVLLFELDIRLYPGWWEHTKESAFSQSFLRGFLWFHLFFAVSTTILWAWTLIVALRKFPSPAAPNSYSPTHRKLARLAAIDMYWTGLNGWNLYWMACVSTAP